MTTSFACPLVGILFEVQRIKMEFECQQSYTSHTHVCTSLAADAYSILEINKIRSLYIM